MHSMNLMGGRWAGVYSMMKSKLREDPVGFPDWTYPITIRGMTIESLAVDIKAQTIDKLKVDIAAQSIALQVTNPAGQSLNVAITSSVALDVKITGSTVTIPVHEAGTANVAIKDSITLNMNIVGSTINVPVVNPAGQSLNVAITSSVTLNIAITGSTINVPVTTAAGQHVDVDIVSSVTINVAIQSCPVTLNVNIASQSVDINIKTSSGANIVIDKLTQGAYTERRSVLENNGTTPSMMGSLKSLPYGKFFPRGCRGYIGTVSVYCDNQDSAPHVLTIHFTVAPGAGDVFSVTLTLPANASPYWRGVSVLRMWNYDSMFIWVESDSDSYGRIGYDTDEPYDSHFTFDKVKWYWASLRCWIRVAMTGQTVGDLPVSGTVNTVQIPNLSSFISSGTSGYSVQPGQSRTIAQVIGAGVCHRLLLWASDDALNFHIYADGVKLYLLPITPLPDEETIDVWHALYYLGGLRSGIMVQVLRSDPDTDNYVLEIAIPIHFRRELLVVAQNPYTDRVCYAAAAVAVSKIS